MFRLMFFALLCSLVVPRAAWGAHLAGHEELSVAGSVHTHHADHAHEHAKDSTGHNTALDCEDGNDGLTHEHSPSFALGSADFLSDSLSMLVWPLASEAQVARERNGVHLRHPESLLRPPRTA
jgi:hypothetical protein